MAQNKIDPEFRTRCRGKAFRMNLSEVQQRLRDLNAIIEDKDRRVASGQLKEDAAIVVRGRMEAALQVGETIVAFTPIQRDLVTKAIRKGIKAQLAQLKAEGVTSPRQLNVIVHLDDDPSVTATKKGLICNEHGECKRKDWAEMTDAEKAAVHALAKEQKAAEREAYGHARKGLSPEAQEALANDPVYLAGLARAAQVQRDIELQHAAQKMDVTSGGASPRVRSDATSEFDGTAKGDPAQRVGDDGPIRLPLAAEGESNGQPTAVEDDDA